MQLEQIKIEEERMVQNPNDKFDNTKIRVSYSASLAPGERASDFVGMIREEVVKELSKLCRIRVDEYLGRATTAPGLARVFPNPPTPSTYTPPAFSGYAALAPLPPVYNTVPVPPSTLPAANEAVSSEDDLAPGAFDLG